MAERADANTRRGPAEAIKEGLHRAIPSHLGGDALGLARRVYAAGRDGRHTLGFAFLNLLAIPLDVALSGRERARYASAPRPVLPQVFVCGAARSGTTLVASSLIRALPVTYFTNVTAVFPRSPITASDLLHLRPRNTRVSSRSLYGRSAGWLGASDALTLWDRWLGSDRTQMPAHFDGETREAMLRFFGAYEQWEARPLVAKNNSLNGVAHLVADVLPNSTFICLDRDPLFLAQSLLEARTFIYDDPARPYGLAPEEAPGLDPVTSVAGQVAYHRSLASSQQRRIGAGRFWIVDYDEFCRDPNSLIERVASELLGVEPGSSLQPFTASRTLRLDPATVARLERELEHPPGADHDAR